MAMSFEHSLFVTHGQICLCDPAIAQPFNDWTEGHFAQGFAWRPGSVSFRTLDEGGPHDVVIDMASGDLALLPNAARVIDVPFDLSKGGKLEVASVAESVSIDFAPGRYQLRFQQLAPMENRDPVIRLSLAPCASPVFKIVRADPDLRPGAELLLTANPAG